MSAAAPPADEKPKSDEQFVLFGGYPPCRLEKHSEDVREERRADCLESGRGPAATSWRRIFCDSLTSPAIFFA